MKRPLKVLVAEIVSIFAQGQKDFDSGKGGSDGAIKAEPALRKELYEAYTEDAHALKELLAENELRLLEIPHSEGRYGMALLTIDNFYLERETLPLTLIFFTDGEVFGEEEERVAPRMLSTLRGVTVTPITGKWLFGIRNFLGIS